MARTQQEVMASLRDKQAQREELLGKLDASLQLEGWFPDVFKKSGGRAVSVQHIWNPSHAQYKVLVTDTREVLFEGRFRDHPDMGFRLHWFGRAVDKMHHVNDDRYRAIAEAYGVPFAQTPRGVTKAKHNKARLDAIRARNKENGHG